MTDLIFNQIDLTTGAGCAIAMAAALVCGAVIAVVYRLGADDVAP